MTNPNQTSDKERLLARLLFWLLLVFLSTGIFLAYISEGYISGLWRYEPGLRLEAFLNGTAYKPYVLRVLAPLLIKAATALVPNDPKFYAAVVMYLSLIGFVLALRYLIHTFWSPSSATDFWVLLSLPALTPLMLINGHIYDLPALFLFTLELALLWRGRFKTFLLLYPIACLNKETTILLTLVFAVCLYNRIERRQFLTWLIVQVAIYVVIRFALLWTFRDNPGPVAEYHLPDQIAFILKAPGLVSIYALFGVVVLALMLHDIASKPHELKQAALVTIPPLVILFLFFGGALEIRVFYEAFPIAYALAIPTLSNLTSWKVEPVRRTS